MSLNAQSYSGSSTFTPQIVTQITASASRSQENTKSSLTPTPNNSMDNKELIRTGHTSRPTSPGTTELIFFKVLPSQFRGLPVWIASGDNSIVGTDDSVHSFEGCDSACKSRLGIVDFFGGWIRGIGLSVL